ncbi:MAG: anaerobic carbon-monoxide dehydrogenase catalytic subunit [Planctomycetota bacterium]
MADEKKKDDKKQVTVDPATARMLDIAAECGISTMFSRAAEMKPCPIGGGGSCCKNCAMGPCRLTGKGAEEKMGVCGATMETIVARNFCRAVAVGASAHSDHGRDLARTLIAVAKGEAKGYEVKDEEKLRRVAGYFGIETEGKSANDIALAVGQASLHEYGKQDDEPLAYTKRAPEPRQKIWRNLGLFPRGVDREVVEMLHRTHMGMDQDANNLFAHAMRVALSDGWGGSMMATDISDILFGTPKAVVGGANLGVLEAKQVNVIVHGHEPTLSEMIAAAANDPEMIEYAKSKGAEGINIAGICCTANEVLMRQGISSAGNFLQQELAILTGAVEAMVVDIQCIAQGLTHVAQKYHTDIVTTSPKVKMPGAVHIQFDEHRAYDIAKEILKRACDNFPKRGKVQIPKEKSPLVAGFSHEYIRYMLGGSFRASFQPLNDNIINGRIQGVAGIVGCNNPRTIHDNVMVSLMKQFVANDVLVAVTGCTGIAGGKHGWLTPEAALEHAGDGLKSVCEAVGIPPVLHLGSCVDNSRILTVLTEVVHTGGLGEDISDLPVVGIAPEWMSEKALSIATYCVATGAYVIMGVTSPVEASAKIQKIMTVGWEELVGGKLEFVIEPEDIFNKSMDHIMKKREALGITEKKERVLFDMEARRKLEV